MQTRLFILRDFFQSAAEKIKRFFRKISALFYPNYRRKMKLDLNFTPELEAITNALIQETIRPGGAMDKEFDRQVDFYRTKGEPIGEQQAKQILNSLLKVAIAERGQLNGRLEQCVESGSLYNRYYSKLQTVYDLHVAASIAQEKMDRSEKDYKDSKDLYDFTKEASFSDDFKKHKQKGADKS